MDKNKSQAINYAYEVLPIMFHSQTNEFLKYLERDGKDFLKFWWDYIGDQLPEAQRQPFYGASCEMLPEVQKTRRALITMPDPQADGEIYYMVVIAKPERRFAWVKFPNTQVIVLVKMNSPENPNGTEIGEITPRGRYTRTRRGPEPTISNMKKIAANAVKPQENR